MRSIVDTGPHRNDTANDMLSHMGSTDTGQELVLRLPYVLQSKT